MPLFNASYSQGAPSVKYRPQAAHQAPALKLDPTEKKRGAEEGGSALASVTRSH